MEIMYIKFVQNKLDIIGKFPLAIFSEFKIIKFTTQLREKPFINLSFCYLSLVTTIVRFKSRGFLRILVKWNG